MKLINVFISFSVLVLNHLRMIELALLLTKSTVMVLLFWRFHEKRSCTHQLLTSSVWKTENQSNSDKVHIIHRRDSQQQCHSVERRLSRSRLKAPQLRLNTSRSTNDNFGTYCHIIAVVLHVLYVMYRT